MPDAPFCAYCRKRPADARWKPFCSERCKMADLGRWLGGEYRIPGETLDLDEVDGDDGTPGPEGADGPHD